MSAKCNFGKLEVKYHLGNLGVDGMMILTRIIYGQYLMM
jgi:hypothetical protein